MRASTIPRDRDTGMFRLYAWVMIITAGLAVGVALLATRTDPQYSATAEILVGPTITPSGNYIQPSMPTEQRVATSAEVTSNAAVKLGVTSKQALEHLSVTVPVDTQVLVMTYTNATPGAAVSGAAAFAQTYLKTRNPADGKNAVASLISPPGLPSTPVATNYPVILGAAILGGLLTGFAVARAWDRVRGRIRTIADAERCSDLDALALTPHLPRTSIGDDQRILTGRSRLDSLAARVLGQVEGGPRPSLLVTGAAPECGSTAVAVLTALALSRMGRVVVLVTADDDVVAKMSRNRDPQHGTKRPTRDLWRDAPATEPGLHLVSVAEWDGAGVAAAKLTNLLPELYDRLPEALIVIDGPPACCSAGMALRADKILLVVALGGSRRSTAAAVQALDHCAEKMVGLVITPRRGHLRPGLVSVRAWAALGVRSIKFRIGPPLVGSAPMHARWSRFGATPSPRGWTDPIIAENHRSTVTAPNGIGDVERLTVPHPNDEPTSSVVS